MKIVINKCYGGFSLSPEATLKLYEYGCTDIARKNDESYWGKDFNKSNNPDRGNINALKEWKKYKAGKNKNEMFVTIFSDDEQYVLDARPDKRDDPRLVRVVEEMGEAANGACASLAIVEIPDGVQWEIDEYDGIECIAEVHRSWG